MIRITELVFGTLNQLMLPIHEDLAKTDFGQGVTTSYCMF